MALVRRSGPATQVSTGNQERPFQDDLKEGGKPDVTGCFIGATLCYIICVGKNRIFRSVWVRLGLGVLGYEAVLVILTWLLHEYWFLRNVSPGDALFVMGVLACATASAGMMRNNPFGEMLSPWGVAAKPVQTTEEEKRRQLMADFVEQRSFGVRLLAAGLLNILLSILVSYLK